MYHATLETHHLPGEDLALVKAVEVGNRLLAPGFTRVVKSYFVKKYTGDGSDRPGPSLDAIVYAYQKLSSNDTVNRLFVDAHVFFCSLSPVPGQRKISRCCARVCHRWTANLTLPPSRWVYLILSCIRLHSWGPGNRFSKRLENLRQKETFFDLLREPLLGEYEPQCGTETGRKRDGNVDLRTSYGNGRTAKILTDAFCKSALNLNKDVCYYSALDIVRARLSSNQRYAACMLPIMDRTPTAMLALLGTPCTALLAKGALHKADADSEEQDHSPRDTYRKYLSIGSNISSGLLHDCAVDRQQ